MQARWVVIISTAVVFVVSASYVHAGSPTAEELYEMLLSLDAKVTLLQEQNAALREQNAALQDDLVRVKAAIVVPLRSQLDPSAVGVVSDEPEHGSEPTTNAVVPATNNSGGWYAAGNLSAVLANEVTITGVDHSIIDGLSNTSVSRPETTKATTDPGLGITAAVGNQLSPWFRLEGEAAYRRIGLDTFENVTSPFGTLDVDGHVDLVTVFGNAYLDAPSLWRITPYVGAGAGLFVASATGETAAQTSLNDDAVGPAFQALAGLSYEISPNWDFTLGYRYLIFPDLRAKNSKFTEGEADTIGIHDLGIGVRRKF